ncbi:MAG: hypothetical protein AB1714_15315 [Acidobacteriota bacterium]
MRDDDIKLGSVNFEHGMLLTPEHFLRMEQYIDSSVIWMLRHMSSAFGLIGGGPRLPESERGAVHHDPIVVIDADDTGVNVTVTQCRALTPAGCIVDIDPAHPIRRRFGGKDLEGVTESPIYVVCTPHEKQPVQGVADEFNPQMQTERRPVYSIALQVHADWTAYSAAVARLRRPPHGAGYEKDPEFIPACTSMVNHSQLAAGWRQVVEAVTHLASRYTELHRAMMEFVTLFKERGIETELDMETMNFTGRMVVALQDCIYGVLDPVQMPQSFFGALRRFFHSAAVYLDLSPSVRQYFELLKESGETEFIALLEQQRKVLSLTPRWNVHDDLGVELRSALQSISSLQRLEGALEGKYLDFHINRALDAMNFVFDRGGKVLYKLAAKPSRVQGFADELTVTFANLRLEGRDKYRLVLVGEQNATFEKGTRITVEIRINEGSGFKRKPLIMPCDARMSGQCNFEFDFEAPDVPTITDLRVALPGHHPFRTALLFVRQRFYAGAGAEPPARHVQPLEAPPSPRTEPVPRPQRPVPPQQPGFGPPEPPAEHRPPWEAPDRGGRRPQEPEPPPQPPRRRRLE